MIAVLAFGIVLLLAVLVSDLAHRSVLSTAVLFLVAGFVLGPGVAGVIDLRPDHRVVRTFAELALFAALALLLARPLALGVALINSELDWRERLVAAWFGPKGFASVLLGLLVLQAGLGRSSQLFHL